MSRRLTSISLLLQNEIDVGVPISTADGLLQYKITADAINKLVSFRCTPVREDGMVGESRSTILQEYVQPGIGNTLRRLRVRLRGETIY